MVNIESAIPLFDEEWLHVAFLRFSQQFTSTYFQFMLDNGIEIVNFHSQECRIIILFRPAPDVV